MSFLQNVCKSLGYWLGGAQDVEPYCSTDFIIKVLVPLTLLGSSFLYLTVLYRTDNLKIRKGLDQVEGLDEEGSSLLSGSGPTNYITLPTEGLDKLASIYQDQFQAYLHKLIELLKCQLVVTFALAAVNWYTVGFRFSNLTSLIFWSYLYFLTVYFDTTSIVYVVRVLTFTVTLVDLYDFHLTFSAKGFTIPLARTLLTSLAIVFETLVLLTSLLMSSSHLPIQTKSKETFGSLEPWSSYFAQLTLEWVRPLLDLGCKQTLKPEDIFDLHPNDEAEFLNRSFAQLGANFTLVSKIFRINWKCILLQFIFSVLAIGFSFGAPLLLSQFLQLMEATPTSFEPPFQLSVEEYGFLLVFSMFVMVVSKSLCSSQSNLLKVRIGTRAKSIVMSQVYAKVLRRTDTTTEKNYDAGKIINLMSSDASELSYLFRDWSFVLLVPGELLIAIYFLYRVVGWSAMVTVLFTVLVMPINHLIGIKYQQAYKDLFAASDRRMNLINELLQGIRIVKLFAWEDQFQTKLSEARANELKQVRRGMVIWVFLSVVYFCFPMLVTFATFYAFTKLAGNVLTPATTFTALFVFKMVSGPVYQLPGGINTLIQAFVSLYRIQGFLDQPEHSQFKKKRLETKLTEPDFIGFKEATLSWGPTNFTMANLNLSFPPRKLSVVVGPTGCGKTSLLLGLLGEMPLIQGSTHLPFQPTAQSPNGVAYVAQTAWLQQDTIRNNILFGKPLDDERYRQVVLACALQPDLDLLPDGDLTEIGEKGITLSGGQKQRIALARAVYSDATHLILDDCLSAVDTHTAKYLFHHCILGPLLANRTKILVTHNLALTLPHSDFVVVLDVNGIPVVQGRYQDVKAYPALPQELHKSTLHPHETTEATPFSESGTKSINVGGKLVLEEERARGAVGWQIYKTYFQATGGLPFWVGFVTTFLLYQFLPLLLDLWVKRWSEMGKFTLQMWDLNRYSILKVVPQPDWKSWSSLTSVPSYQLDHYIQIYLLLVLANALIIVVVVSFGFYGSLNASQKIHDALLANLLRANFRFFDRTPLGRIVNRFGSDFQVVDQQLMGNAITFVRETLASVFVLLMIVYILPQFLWVATLVVVVFTQLTYFYIQGSRELKRIESVTRSPIFAHCDATLQGVATIRAFQHTDRFLQTHFRNVNHHLKFNFYLFVANQWLAIRSDLACGLVTLGTGILLLTFQAQLDPAFMGLAFTYALNFSTHVLWIAQFYANLEMNLNSVERIQEYMDMPIEPQASVENCRPPTEWPSSGRVQVDHLTLRYSANHDPVIQNLSFTIEAGQRIGIVGRTGAGKSTLALSMFRFLEAEVGSIRIDSVDIARIGLKDLRSNLTIIPQEATLFSGTIRSNLDPFDQFTDLQLWQVLRQVYLVPTTTPTPESLKPMGATTDFELVLSLDQVVLENGTNFSHGQRQLLALARALLRKSKVVLMDEATAMVDFQTDIQIQRTIRNQFQNCTLICIAHRLQTIIDYDKILVLDKGNGLEFDSPKQLLLDSNSEFYKLCKESGALETLKTLAKQQ